MIFNRIYKKHNKIQVWFIHIPKNAGTSISNAIKKKSITHITASQVLKSDKKEQFLKSFSFCVVRNPFERFLSLYNYARMEKSYYHNNIEPEKAINGKHLDYELLKNASLQQCVNYLEAGKLKHDLTWNQWEPQYKWVCDETKKILVDKVYNINELNLLKKDLLKICKLKIDIPILNKSYETTQLINLDKRSKQKLLDYYHLDFELFNLNKNF